MFKLSCEDLGLDCHFKAEGATREEVIQQMSAHVGAKNDPKFKDVPAADVDNLMNDKIHEST